MRAALVVLLLACADPLYAQDQPSLTVENPLAALKDQLARALTEGGLPFTDEQERAIVLMMDERFRASETLFGDLMNFRSGPTSGQEADRLKSAIDWMRKEFASQITQYLTEAQRTVWSQLEAATLAATTVAEKGGAATSSDTQYVRINNNAFTAEGFFFRTGGSSTEVIQRGGVGAWHGNAEYLMKDEALNARNAFAGNKPPYQERQLSLDSGGPVIPGRLTSNIFVNYDRSENVGTIRATLASEEIFALGITRPEVDRSVEGQNILQLSDANSLRINVRYSTSANESQGIGGFTLPERAWTFEARRIYVELKQFSALSAASILESRLAMNRNANDTLPQIDAIRINVLDAFSSGGAQNKAEDRDRWYDFSNLYTRFGESLTIKAGMAGTYRYTRSLSPNNFGGTFTFSTLEVYRTGRALQYRVNRGNPLLETTQLEMGAFIQNDLKVTPQLTFLFGARYDAQTNIGDHNNLSPRLGFAYGIGPATVIRGGAGMFHQRLGLNEVENQRRLNGTHQFEIVIDNPSFPDPAGSGSIRTTFPSVRVTDPDLQTPTSVVGMISLERTLWRNLLVTATYDHRRESHRFRLRNLNAPVDTTSPVPRACRPGQSAETCVKPNPGQGNVINLESTGEEINQNLRINGRQRFGIFNVTAFYEWQRLRNEGGTQLPADNFDLHADWSHNQNPRHEYGSTVNARLPLGIFLSGTMSANSGRYYNITTGSDDNRDTNVNDRPPGLPRNAGHGPRYLNFDFNLSKAFFLGADSGGTRKNVNLFANLTNAFNRVHYETPSGVMSSPNFGRSTGADDPREIEVGFRFQF